VTSWPQITRRDILGIAAMLGAHTLAIDKAFANTVRSECEETLLLIERLLAAHPPRQSLTSIGMAYWRTGEDAHLACQHRPSVFLNAFLDHIEWSEDDLLNASPNVIRDHIRSGTTRDFSEGRIVQIQGWLLSETEARLCAIAALDRV